MRAFGGDGTFQKNLASDPDVLALLTADELAKLFDLDHALAHARTIVDRALTSE